MNQKTDKRFAARFRVRHLLLATFLVALQIQSIRFSAVGLGLSVILFFISTFVLIAASAVLGGSTDKPFAEQPVMKMATTMIMWSSLNIIWLSIYLFAVEVPLLR